jgi:hypothetical protein
MYLIYSDFKLFTGLAIAALIVCRESVSKAINTITTPASKKVHQLICVR